ncbi:rhomboid family intramembrane serine protease [Nocardioides sp. zg-579]|uniref:Rhomboid family intramembrane serine protease n=2 Tax=Nocardioides marmotae TaxID=2663857 RepID=A0A6I3JDR3_9ACTN|nr:rhomboid family intramembrane serine protease [Gordonia jinghuaiqii]MTB96260.1 rhomboid family intramembrane serine protease [Nocardioides marmotae]QKE03236.1 rhomboid family intramembrane serine protease [Nocardioides marmotae]
MPVCYRHPDRESHIRCQRCGRPICPDCMRDAAVGFQCPDCVAEGARTMRSGRTAYGGALPGRPGSTSIALIAINVAVWVAVLVTGGAASRLVDLLALRPKGLCLVDGGGYDVPQDVCANGGTWLPGVADGAFWQVLTSGFTHQAVLHIAFNMFALYVLGPQLEAALGRWRFLALYFLSLLAGSAVVLWFGGEYQATLGASGAVYGLFAALFVLARKVGGDVRQIGVLIAVNVVLTLAVPGISWQGHLGGFAGGLLVALVLVYAPRGPRRTTVQVAGLAAITLFVAVAIVTRVLVLA